MGITGPEVAKLLNGIFTLQSISRTLHPHLDATNELITVPLPRNKVLDISACFSALYNENTFVWI